MAEPETLETLSAALETLRGTLTTLSGNVKKNGESIDAIAAMDTPAESVPLTDFEKVKDKVKENFALLENSLRDAFSQIEKNAQSIQTCIDEIRVVGGSDRNLRRPASVSTSTPFTLLEL